MYIVISVLFWTGHGLMQERGDMECAFQTIPDLHPSVAGGGEWIMVILVTRSRRTCCIGPGCRLLRCDLMGYSINSAFYVPKGAGS